MAPPSWKNSELWERVRHARRLSKYAESGEAAARALGMNAGTYRAYERPSNSSKSIKLTADRAAAIAEKFGVRFEWLLKGDGEPIEDPEEKAAIAAFLAGRRSRQSGQ